MIFGTINENRGEYLNASREGKIEMDWGGGNGDTKKPITESLSGFTEGTSVLSALISARSGPICSFDILESIKRGGGYGYARKKAARIRPGGITNSIQWREGRRRISSR